MFKQVCLVLVALTLPIIWGEDEISNYRENAQKIIDYLQEKVNKRVANSETQMQLYLDELKEAGAPIAEQARSEINENFLMQIKAINETATQMGLNVSNCFSSEWDTINKITNSTIDDVNKCVQDQTNKVEDVIKKAKENNKYPSLIDSMKYANDKCKDEKLSCYIQATSNIMGSFEKMSEQINNNLLETLANTTTVTKNYTDCIPDNVKKANEKFKNNYNKIQECVNATMANH